jgi:acyl-CoA reductase-like NAD-dependent aldehyde dehydrogenase
MTTWSIEATPPTADGRDLFTMGTFEVVNPATGKVFAHAPSVRPDQLDYVFSTALRAYESWKDDEPARRAALRAAADRLDSAVDELAPLLTAEQGKPLADARDEITRSALWLRYFAELDVPRDIVRDDAEASQEVVRRPLGVVTAITPWNVPILLAMWKIAPALRAGNTVVVKPSPYTPLTTLAMGRLLRDVLPAGVLSVISGPEPLGAAAVAHRIPRKVSFTGSIAVGRQVGIAAAADFKRVTLELGGNDPAIVLDDVDVARIVPTLFWGAFLNNGQVCLAAKRIYAHRSIQAELVEAMASFASTVTVDDGALPGAQLGPLNNLPQYDRIKDLVDDAVRNGARVAFGGAPLDRDGYFYPPTVLSDVTDGIRVVDEEQFGPVMPIIAFDDEADAVRRANRGDYGLTASVWSTDPARAYALAAQVDSGQVTVNIHGAAAMPTLPFGGHKNSGIGVENGLWGLHSFTETQVIAGPPRHRS